MSAKTYRTVPVRNLSSDELLELSKKQKLSLSREDMEVVQQIFREIDRDPTDVELEVIAQTWSEHCKHKIFASKISYTDKEAGTSETINSLYKTCIMNTTKQIRESLGDRDFCRSVFKDNAGVIAFTPEYDAASRWKRTTAPRPSTPTAGR